MKKRHSSITNPSTQPFTTTTSLKLWQQSEITIPFVSPQLSFQREHRFKWSSIYWPQNTNPTSATHTHPKSQIDAIAAKISKLIDEQEKNESRFKQLKHSLSRTQSLHNNTRQTHSVLSTRKPFTLDKHTQQIVDKLTHKPKNEKQSILRDRYGNRCQLFEDPEQQQSNITTRRLSQSTGFSTGGTKMKLQLPHNFNPGPGSYQIQRYPNTQDSPRKSMTSRTKHSTPLI